MRISLELETRYNVGDKVKWHKQGSICSFETGKIWDIIITLSPTRVKSIAYEVQHESGWHWTKFEDALYPAE